MSTVVIKKYDKTKYPSVVIPNSAVGSNSIYITEDLRFVVYKQGSEWAWRALTDLVYNDIDNLSRYDTTKTSCVETIQRVVEEELYDEELWKK